jgi:hypothetical protein
MRGQCQTATGSRTGNIRDRGLFADRLLPGQQNIVSVGGARLSSGQYADTLWYFSRPCGGWLTGNCRLPLAVGGEQRAATDSGA